jgi:CubicO group peptidase (beta-lactamase class C family)
MIRLFQVLSMCLAIGACGSTGVVGKSQLTASFTKSEASIESIRAKYSLPALASLKAVHGKVTVNDVAGKRRVDATDRALRTDAWHLGSNTKAMTAALVAMLIEERKLDWTSRLVALLPDIPVHASYSNATVEMLMTHRAGVPEDLMQVENGALWELLWNPALDVREGRAMVARRVLSVPAASAPGAKFGYSNAGYIILGHVIERLTGKPWETVLKERLFSPLKMSRCGFGSAGVNAPWGHTMAEDGATLIPFTPGFFADNPPTLGPAGTVHCPLVDYARFLDWQIDGVKGRSKILSRATFEKLHTAWPGDAYTYGAWFRVDPDWAHGYALTHGGSNTMFIAIAWVAPGIDTSLVAATNAATEGAGKGLDDAIGLMLDP